MGAEFESIARAVLYVLGCGMLGGFIRYLKHGKEGDSVDRAKVTASMLSSSLCSLGAFAVCGIFSMPFAFTSFMMILFGFFDGRLLEAMDKGLATFIEHLGVAVVHILEHWGTKE